MKRNEFEQLILSELRDLRADVKEGSKVQSAIKEHIAAQDERFKGELKQFKHGQKLSTRVETVIAAVLAIVVSKFTGAH